ncbi:MAG: restriction endonuclease [Pyrinomonadaceae bacterium]|nr:restriction endonuclease [Pyrinomonadaceae bacterium]MBP6213386.1 restriction endonuclease [Pyrinomonadaceae bacterium]
MTKQNLSDSGALCAKLTHATLRVLQKNGGEMRGKDVLEQITAQVEFNEWESNILPQNGEIRWRNFYSRALIEPTKAGFLIKRKGIWYLTPEGEEALKSSPTEIWAMANKKYKEWKTVNPTQGAEELDSGLTDTSSFEVPNSELSLERFEQLALESITDAINAKTAYEFQDLAAALLRAMGYFTPFVAPRGKDGGVDIMAYRDPLGTLAPRIKIQIKHRESTTPVADVRQLMGLLQKDGDVGIFFSTGGFTPDAKSTARGSHVHVELIDLDRFIILWRQFYDKLKDDDKAMLPLTPVYFIASLP